MFICKLILFTFATSFSVLGHIHVDVDEDSFTRQLLGTWYTNAMISPEFNSSVTFSCSRTNLTEEYSRTHNNVHNRVNINGVHSDFEGVGRVVNSELYIAYRIDGIGGTRFGITPFSNNQEMILHDRNDDNYYLMLCRQRNPSADIITAFEGIAARVKIDIKWVDQQNCD